MPREIEEHLPRGPCCEPYAQYHQNNDGGRQSIGRRHGNKVYVGDGFQDRGIEDTERYSTKPSAGAFSAQRSMMPCPTFQIL